NRGETAITQSLAALFAHPTLLLSTRGFVFVGSEASGLLLRSTPLPSWLSEGVLGVALVSVVVGVLRRRVDRSPAFVVVTALVLAAGAYGILTTPLQTYFLISLLGALAVAVALVFQSWFARPRVRCGAGLA